MLKNFEDNTHNLSEEELQIAQSVKNGLKKYIGKSNAKSGTTIPGNKKELLDTIKSISQRIDSQLQVINQLKKHL